MRLRYRLPLLPAAVPAPTVHQDGCAQAHVAHDHARLLLGLRCRPAHERCLHAPHAPQRTI
eukprot:COSAG01_NODE_53215_length_340_cov_15.157676_1_plen_60_part_01